MKFKVEKASDWNFEEEIEINSLEDLKNLQDSHTNREGAPDWVFPNPDLIVDFNKKEIIIYDYYL